MKQFRTFPAILPGRRRSAVVLAIGSAAFLFGCSSKSDKTSSAPVAPAPAAPQAPLPNLMQLHVDEDGQIPVLAFGDLVAGSSASAGNITVDQFKKDLDWLYANNYRPIGLKDMVAGKVDVPAGKSPVVLTFDGGGPGQFRTMPDGSTDPNCAAAILEAFNNEHLDWPLKGAFIIPSAMGIAKSEFDGQNIAYKLERLTGDGFDMGSSFPASISSLSPAKIQDTIASGLDGLQSIGINPVQVVEVPESGFPHEVTFLEAGQTLRETARHQGPPGKQVPGAHVPPTPPPHVESYSVSCVITGGNRPSVSPVDMKFNPYHIPRITVDSAHPLNVALKSVTKKFVSDGDAGTITVLNADKNNVDAATLQKDGLTLRTYAGGNERRPLSG